MIHIIYQRQLPCRTICQTKSVRRIKDHIHRFAQRGIKSLCDMACNLVRRTSPKHETRFHTELAGGSGPTISRRDRLPRDRPLPSDLPLPCDRVPAFRSQHSGCGRGQPAKRAERVNGPSRTRRRASPPAARLLRRWMGARAKQLVLGSIDSTAKCKQAPSFHRNAKCHGTPRVWRARPPRALRARLGRRVCSAQTRRASGTAEPRARRAKRISRGLQKKIAIGTHKAPAEILKFLRVSSSFGGRD